LLPATLFAPFFFGPPLTLPFGFVYWALDYKPSPNWLNSVPPSDWLDKLLNGNNAPGGSGFNPLNPNENCKVDLGLPSPQSNSRNLNDYYSQQNPPPSAPPLIELTGQEGPAPEGTAANPVTTPERTLEELEQPTLEEFENVALETPNDSTDPGSPGTVGGRFSADGSNSAPEPRPARRASAGPSGGTTSTSAGNVSFSQESSGNSGGSQSAWGTISSSDLPDE
jgi:hypothetical protein